MKSQPRDPGRWDEHAELLDQLLPERLELVDELPLSPFGKVSKVALTKRIAETLRAEAS